MNKIQKPEWLLYGEKVREQLTHITDNKSGKQTHRRVESSYRLACAEKGYRGSLADWYYVVRIRLRRNW